MVGIKINVQFEMLKVTVLLLAQLAACPRPSTGSPVITMLTGRFLGSHLFSIKVLSGPAPLWPEERGDVKLEKGDGGVRG